MSLISIVVTLIVVGVVLYLVTLIPMDATVKKLINLVVVVAVILWLISVFLPGIANIHVGH